MSPNRCSDSPGNTHENTYTPGESGQFGSSPPSSTFAIGFPSPEALELVETIPQSLDGRLQLWAIREVRQLLSFPFEDAIRTCALAKFLVIHHQNPKVFVGGPSDFVEQDVMVPTKQHPVSNVSRCPTIAHRNDVGRFQAENSTANAITKFAEATLLMISFPHGCRKSLISQGSDLGRLSFRGFFKGMEWWDQLFRGRHLLPGNRLSAKHEVPSVEPLYISEA